MKGVFTATGMPFYMIETTVRFESGKMISGLKTYAKGGETGTYTEVIERNGKDEFRWKLFQGKNKTGKTLMEDTFTRGPNP